MKQRELILFILPHRRPVCLNLLSYRGQESPIEAKGTDQFSLHAPWYDKAKHQHTKTPMQIKAPYGRLKKPPSRNSTWRKEFLTWYQELQHNHKCVSGFSKFPVTFHRTVCSEAMVYSYAGREHQMLREVYDSKEMKNWWLRASQNFPRPPVNTALL